jgi:hypothetical protein
VPPNWEQEKREHSDFELQFNLSKLWKAVDGFVQLCASQNPLRETPREGVQRLAFCVETLTHMVQIVLRESGERLPRVSQGLRRTVELLLDQIEHLQCRMEDILEAWQIYLDPELSTKIDEALETLDKTRTDIADWRDMLELVSH